MKLTFCAACSSTADLEHHHLIPRSEGGSDEDDNLITLCCGCHAKLHERHINGAYNIGELTRAGLAPRVMSGKSLRKLTLETEKEIYDAFESGVSPGQLAITYSVSRYSIYEAVKRYKKIRLGQ